MELSKPEDVIYEAIGHCYDKQRQFAQARFYYRKASHLNQDDSKLIYKIACTYLNEGQWVNAVKQLEAAIRLQGKHPEYHLALGECKIQLLEFKDAILAFGTVVRLRQKNISGWEALVRCLYLAEMYKEALEQVQQAIRIIGEKPLLTFYMSAIYFAMGKSKEGLIHLDKALARSPKLLKKMIALNPSLLQSQSIVDVIARYRKR